MANLDIFISYKREERELVEILQVALNEAGFVVGTDADIKPNDDFIDAIETMIDTARATLVLWTAASSQSKFVKMEARHALDLDERSDRDNIYRGILLEDHSLPMDFNRVNMMDFSSNGLTTHAVNDIVDEMVALLNKPNIDPIEARKQSSDYNAELQAFLNAQIIGEPNAFEGFLSAYPNSILTPLAKRRLKEIKKVWPNVLRKTLTLGGLAVVFSGLGVFVPLISGLVVQPSNQHEVPELATKLEEAQSSLKTAELNLDATSSKLVREQSRAKDLQKSLDKKRDQLADSEKEYLETIKGLNLKISENTQLLNAANAEKSSLFSEAESLQGQNESLSENIQSLEREKLALTSQHQKDIKVLEANLTSFEDNLKLANARIRTLTTEHQSKVSTLQADINTHKKELKSLEVTLLNAVSQRDQALTLVDSLKSQIQKGNQSSAASNNGASTKQKIPFLEKAKLLWGNKSILTVQNLQSALLNIKPNYDSSWYSDNLADCGGGPEVTATLNAIIELMGYRVFATGELLQELPNRKLHGYQSNYPEPARSQATLTSLLSTLTVSQAREVSNRFSSYLSRSQAQKLSLHADILLQAKIEYENIYRSDSVKAAHIGTRSLHQIKQKSPYFSYCPSVAFYAFSLNYDEIKIDGSDELLAYYPVMFWSRREADGTYEQAEAALDGFLSYIKSRQYCSTGRCQKAAPYKTKLSRN